MNSSSICIHGINLVYTYHFVHRNIKDILLQLLPLCGTNNDNNQNILNEQTFLGIYNWLREGFQNDNKITLYSTDIVNEQIENNIEMKKLNKLMVPLINVKDNFFHHQKRQEQRKQLLIEQLANEIKSKRALNELNEESKENIDFVPKMTPIKKLRIPTGSRKIIIDDDDDDNNDDNNNNNNNDNNNDNDLEPKNG